MTETTIGAAISTTESAWSRQTNVKVDKLEGSNLSNVWAQRRAVISIELSVEGVGLLV